MLNPATTYYATLLTTGLALALPAAAQDKKAEEKPKVDKTGYHLFNPTPKEAMRELSTDRPDKTESAYTVDAGRIQVELDFFGYTYAKDNTPGNNTKTTSWGIMPLNLKFGLTHNTDIQFVHETYTREKVDDRNAGTVARTAGRGDLTVRLKHNFWGNDDGDTAFAAMPFVKFPTAKSGIGNTGVEAGIILPLAIALPNEWGMGLMTQYTYARNDPATDSKYHHEFVNSITVSHDIVGNLGGYAELWTQVSTERGSRFQATADFGLTYAVTDNIQLDGGVNIGLTRASDDFNPFIGLSFRF